jgi:hypothetical protein
MKISKFGFLLKKKIRKSKLPFLHIVMKVALFYTQNRSESSTFLHEKS